MSCPFRFYLIAVKVWGPTAMAAWSKSWVCPLACWDCGFKSWHAHGYLYLVSVVCCQVDVFASGWSLAQRSPTECVVSECDREALFIRERLHGSLWLINAIESTKVNRVNSTFQRKWSTGLKQVGDGQLSFNVFDSLWVICDHHGLLCKQASHDLCPSV
jgi:hypothetical protein